MLIVNPDAHDWQFFLSLAATEGWIIPFQEQRLFQNLWRPYFFVLKHKGEHCGFVSAVAYKESGWIGNLLVAKDKRRHGYGSALLEHAIGFLKQSSPQRIWLTASDQGAPLYQRRGFQYIDSIERWTGKGSGILPALATCDLGQLIDLDTRCWGESRAPLLSQLEFDSFPICVHQCYALLQAGPGSWQLGPWLTGHNSPGIMRQLLHEAIRRTPFGRPLIIDALLSSRSDLMLLDAGFQKTDKNSLMCLSEQPPKLHGVLALASLGSMG